MRYTTSIMQQYPMCSLYNVYEYCLCLVFYLCPTIATISPHSYSIINKINLRTLSEYLRRLDVHYTLFFPAFWIFRVKPVRLSVFFEEFLSISQILLQHCINKFRHYSIINKINLHIELKDYLVKKSNINILALLYFEMSNPMSGNSSISACDTLPLWWSKILRAPYLWC